VKIFKHILLNLLATKTDLEFKLKIFSISRIFHTIVNMHLSTKI
jgi:hypothetical protein